MTKKITLRIVFFAITVILVYACVRIYDAYRADHAHAPITTNDLKYCFGYIVNDRHKSVLVDDRGEVLLENVHWMKCGHGDSLAAYEQHSYCGYININTGKIVVPANKYIMANEFSEGRALVGTKDSLYIIDANGKVVGRGFPNSSLYDSNLDCFKSGYLPMLETNGMMGLIDRDANWVIEPFYNHINYAIDRFWIFQKEAEPADGVISDGAPAHAVVMDDSLRIVMQGDWTYVNITKSEGIVVGDENNWQYRYDFDGTLKNKFVCDHIVQLRYKTGEKKFVTIQSKDEYSDNVIVSTEEREVTETATLSKYVTSTGCEGLITSDGKPVTAPLYWGIEAVGKNLFLCSIDREEGHRILLNENGRVVE